MGLGETVLPKIYNTDFIDEENYFKLRNSFNFSEPWTPEELHDALENKSYIRCSVTGGIVSAFPLPFPPESYNPLYRPKLLILHSVSNDVFSAVDAMDDKITRDFVGIAMSSVLVGLVGILIMFGILWFVSRMLTRPLLWIENVAWSIVNRTDERANESLRVTQDDENHATMNCSSGTEISQLVKGEYDSNSRVGVANPVGQLTLFSFPNPRVWFNGQRL